MMTRRAVTSTAVLHPHDMLYASSCVDRDGHLYFTLGRRFCIHKAHVQRGRCSAAAVLSGAADVQGSADGDAADARFLCPQGVCISPVDPDTLVVVDVTSLRAVDVVTGAARTLAPSSVDVQPCCILGCASDGRHHIWFIDDLEGDDDLEEGDSSIRLLRLDVRSLEFHQVPLAEDCNITRMLCTDNFGNVICTRDNLTQLWRVQPDGTTTLLAGTAEAGYRDGPAAQAQFGTALRAAAAGDGSIVVADRNNCRLRLVSPDGTVSTLAGSGAEGVVDGPLAEAQFHKPGDLVVSPGGDVLVIDFDKGRTLLRTVPAGLPPPTHLVPKPAPPHPAAALTGGLLQSGLLADAVMRVAVRGAAPQQGACHPELGDRGVLRELGPAGAPSSQAGGPADPSTSSTGQAATVDIPCHRAILAGGCAYFRALFAGPLAQQQQQQQEQQQQQQQHAAATTGAAGRKRKAAGAEPTCAEPGEQTTTAAPVAAVAVPVVVVVDDASADAVRAVLRHVYTGDLGGVTAATAQDVLYLAQRWGLEGLLEAGQAYVAEQLLGPGNAAEWLVVAEGRQYGAVRAAALRAVVEHIAEVRGDAAQAALLEAHPKLLMEALMLARGVAPQHVV